MPYQSQKVVEEAGVNRVWQEETCETLVLY